MNAESTNSNIEGNKPFGAAIRKGVPTLDSSPNISTLADLQLRKRQANAASVKARNMLADNFDLLDNKYFGDKFRGDPDKKKGEHEDVRRAPLLATPLKLIASGLIGAFIPAPLAAGGSGLIWSATKMAGSYIARRWLKNRADDAITGIVGLVTKKKEEKPTENVISGEDKKEAREEARNARKAERELARVARRNERAQKSIDATLAQAAKTSEEMKAEFRLKSENIHLQAKQLTAEEEELRKKLVERARQEREAVLNDYAK